MNIASSEFQPTDDKPSMKWAWSRHVTCFKFLSLPKVSLERLKLNTLNLVFMLIRASPRPMDDKLSLKVAWSLSRDVFIFWKISDNISKTVQDSIVVSVKFK